MKLSGLAISALLVWRIEAIDVPGVVLWDIERRQHAPLPLHRRAEQTVEEVITNEKQRGGYYSTCQVGTPLQPLVLQLDTGSSDSWVPSMRAAICSTRFSPNPCPLGSYDPDVSSTFKDFLPGQFKISYLDESYSEGDFVTDTFEIGDAVLENFTMGLGLNTSISHGLVGIGYTINEVSIRTNGTEYDNLPVALARSGITNSVAYSLWLNDLDASTGNVLFGGVDTEKYKGDMTRVDVLPDEKADGAFTHFTIALTSLDATSPSGSDTLTTEEFPVEVILDSGTTLTFLPADLVQQMWEEAGVEFNDQLNQGLIPCYRRNSPGSYTFGFGGPDGAKIQVSMDELVLDLTLGGAPSFPRGSAYEGQDACLFGIQAFSQSPYIMGDTFLRSAYVVYDLVNNEIGLAQTDFNETGTNIVAFPSNGSTIPSATVAPNQGQTDTPAGVVEPPYAAREGFQNGAFLTAAFQASTLLAIGLAFLVAI